MALEEKLNQGAFVVLAEMEPPKGVDVSPMISCARKVKGEVDAFVVPEMSNAVMRMSSLGAAAILEAQAMETVMQVNCRDRNRIALQADLLAANGCNIGNVMAVAGEEPSFGDHHQARPVYDIDLMELLAVIRGLQEGRDMAGIELKGAPHFLVGATTMAGSRDRSPDLVWAEIKEKSDIGVSFFISPPLFDLSAIHPFLRRMDSFPVRMIPTVLLLKSVGMARYISRNADHVWIPETLIDRLHQSPDKRREGVRIAAETIGALKREGLAGALVATLGWEDQLPEILARVD